MKRIGTHTMHVLLSFLFLSLLGLVSCVTTKLNSGWLDRKITVDGMTRDWLGALIPIEEKDITVGILNDENYLYLCLLSENPYLHAQFMRQGFTVWFDPTGGKNKTFGIKFPVGVDEGEDFLRSKEDEVDLEDFRRPIRGSMRELEILGPDGDKGERMPVSQAKGISVHLDASSKVLAYEIRVPLIKSETQPYAIGAKPGMTIGIGLVSPRFDPTMMRRGMGGMPGVSRRPGMGGMPGMGRGSRMFIRPMMTKTLKVWLTTKLAHSLFTRAAVPGSSRIETAPGRTVKQRSWP